MLPKQSDLLEKKNIILYNNIAEIEGVQGRLLVEFQISSEIQIKWDFETLGNPEKWIFTPDFGKPLSTIRGYEFEVNSPYVNNWTTEWGPLNAIRGVTPQVVYGGLETEAHEFIFYLPNAQFQQKSLKQTRLRNEVHDDTRRVSWSSGGRKVEVKLDEFWSLSLETSGENLEWLDPKNRNTGYKLTTIGYLYQHKFDATKEETFAMLQAMKLQDALTRLQNVSALLQFANSSKIRPLFVRGEFISQHPLIRKEIACATALNYPTSSLEQLGSSWIHLDTDLASFLGCLKGLEKMIQQPFWKVAYAELMTTYLQAAKHSQPQNIAAMMVGAALERLSYAILVEDEIDPKEKQKYELLFSNGDKKQARAAWNLGNKHGQLDVSITNMRARLLLERIGLTKNRDYDDIDEIKLFETIRNDATHAIAGTTTSEERSKLIKLGLLWIEEVLLWRLGYDGKYSDRRASWVKDLLPRYDLSLRNPNW